MGESLKIRVYTQYGTDEKRQQYAYCSAYQSPLDANEDGDHLMDTRRVFVGWRDNLDNVARMARALAWHALSERFMQDISKTVTIEFHKAQDDAG